jgi:hypothetical protein
MLPLVGDGMDRSNVHADPAPFERQAAHLLKTTFRQGWHALFLCGKGS